MSRPRGGVIGVNATPAASAINSAASGVWTLREAEANRRAGTWPTAPRQPGAPSGLSVAAGNASLTLSWTAPTSDLPITGYIVEYTASGGSAQTISTGTTATTYAITGLTNGTTYTMRVAAVSDAGAGAYSATANGTPGAASVPGAPRSITVTPCGCGFATISWLAPLSDGGSAVTSYRLRASRNNYATFRAVAAPSLTTGCINGSDVISGVNLNNPSYVLRIYAVNAIGESSSYAEFTENNGFANGFGADCS